MFPKSLKKHELRTAFNLGEQNAKTHKDPTLAPNQDAIQRAVAQARRRSKFDAERNQADSGKLLRLRADSCGVLLVDDEEDASIEGKSP